MGGNARAIDRATGQTKRFLDFPATASQISLENISLKWLRQDLKELFYIIDASFQKQTKVKLWERPDVGMVFTGSATHLFANRDAELLRVKPLMGDIDVTVPVESLDALFGVLASLEGKKLTETMTYVGQNDLDVKRNQINSIFYYEQEGPPFRQAHGVFLQVDFEGVKYADGTPQQFVIFARSSPWDDLLEGIKGVAHKYLLMVLAWVTSSDDNVVILTDKSPSFPPRKIRIKTLHEPPRHQSFSVDRGLRARLKPVLYNGNQLLVNGKPAYKELQTADSEYQTDVSKIFKAYFGLQPLGGELEKFQSFVGTLELCEKYLTKSQIIQVYREMVAYKLFGPGQQLYRDSASADRHAKHKIIAKFFEKFPYLTNEIDIKETCEKYYLQYRHD